jgi:versiconal hemiacetal acetate esterase
MFATCFSACLWMFVHFNLTSCRVSVKLDYYQGLPHVFWAFECPAPGGDFVADIVASIRIFTHT